MYIFKLLLSGHFPSSDITIPEHIVFLSLDPDPGDADDILTQNGYAYANNNPVMIVDPDGEFVCAAGFFVPSVGQVMLIGTAAVVGAYGAWYLGKKLGEIDWDHIKEEPGPKSNKKMKDGKKPKSNRTLKRTTRANARTKPVRTGRYGRTIHEKTFKRPVGTDTRGKPTNRVRVIREPSGKVVTSFPF
jgi:hypothetical protein